MAYSVEGLLSNDISLPGVVLTFSNGHTQVPFRINAY